MIRVYLTVLVIALSTMVTSAQHLNIADAINSKYDEQHPVLLGTTHLFYTLANHPDNVGGTKDKGDIWYSTWQDSTWSMPIHAGNVINNKKWNAVIGFTADGSMLLHHHYTDGRQGISIAAQQGNSWSAPSNVAIPYFMNKSKMQSASVSPDGQAIVFSIESYGTMGAEDLYVVRKKNNQWTDLTNLGSEVNSKFQELTPVISADNKTLFFASNGWGGKGSMDVFNVERLDDTWLNWSDPINITEVNSTGRELSFYFDATTNSARFITTQDSDGYGDIKYFKFSEALTDSAVVVEAVVRLDTVQYIEETAVERYLIQGTVVRKSDQQSIDGNVLVMLNNETVQNATTDKGKFRISLDSIATYQVKIASPGYLPYITTIVLDSTQQRITIAAALNAIVVGEAVKLDNVLFEQGTTTLVESSYSDLDEVVAMMIDNPSMQIELAGHTDNQGNSKMNVKLSKERADKVKQYSVSKKISAKRISGKGYGGSRPIASNKNAESRKMNRRVEFIVLRK